MCRNTENNTNFQYRTNSEIQNSLNSKKIVFGPFNQLSGQKLFSKNNLALPHKTSSGVLVPFGNIEKSSVQFHESTWTDGKKEGQNLFHRNPLEFNKGNCSRMDFKSLRDRLRCCSNQKSSSLDNIIFKIHQILGSH